MPRAPRIPRAQVVALSRPDPVLSSWTEWGVVVFAVTLLALALLAH